MAVRETRNLEYKSELSKSFLKTVSAFANYGKGEIIFGVDDEGMPKGLMDIKEKALQIENFINGNLKPVPRFSIELETKLSLVYLTVYEGLDKPYYYDNKAYKRADSSSIEVDRLELTRLILEGSNMDYESLPSKKSELNFDSLENKLKETIHIDALNKDILRTLNLVNHLNQYTYAAELLSSDNQFMGIEMVRFGRNINEILYRKTLESQSVLDQFEEATDLFLQYYTYEQIEGVHRTRLERIPQLAFREALANAIVHRTWDVKSAISIFMYEDHLEIVSPGALPTGLSEQDYLKGQVSILRNPILANVFFRLKYIEKLGMGIRRILLAYEDSYLKPKFDFQDNFNRVILPITDHSIELLTMEEQSLYHALRLSHDYRRKDLEEKSGYNKDKMIRVLNKLLAKNLIERSGQGPSSTYRKR